MTKKTSPASPRPSTRGQAAKKPVEPLVRTGLKAGFAPPAADGPRPPGFQGLGGGLGARELEGEGI